MLLIVATISLLARRAYNSLQYSLYYAVFTYLLLAPDVRVGRDSFILQLMYFGAVWRSMSMAGAPVPQRIMTILLLVIFKIQVHPENWILYFPTTKMAKTWISDFPTIKMILQYSIHTEVILWGYSFLSMFIITSQNSQLWVIRWASRLERLDHKIWMMRTSLWGILYTIVYDCSGDAALWVSLKCFGRFGLRGQKLICRLTARIICRLVFSRFVTKFRWWTELILIVVSSPISSILHRCWLKATIYLLEEETILSRRKGVQIPTSSKSKTHQTASSIPLDHGDHQSMQARPSFLG